MNAPPSPAGALREGGSSPAHPADFPIRRMTLEDVPAVHALDVLSFNLPWPEKSYRFELTENPVAMGWVMHDPQGALVGMMVVWVIVDEAHIATIAIHPDFRGRGLARRLLVTGLEAARRQGAHSATLEVRDGNRVAQGLYRSLGFEIVGCRARYYKDTGEDAIIMTLFHLNQLLPGNTVEISQ